MVGGAWGDFVCIHPPPQTSNTTGFDADGALSLLNAALNPGCIRPTHGRVTIQSIDRQLGHPMDRAGTHCGSCRVFFAVAEVGILTVRWWIWQGVAAAPHIVLVGHWFSLSDP